MVLGPSVREADDHRVVGRLMRGLSFLWDGHWEKARAVGWTLGEECEFVTWRGHRGRRLKVRNRQWLQDPRWDFSHQTHCQSGKSWWLEWFGGCIQVVEMGPYGEEKRVARTTF